jgi:uncharacterized protein (TIGR00661 family)
MLRRRILEARPEDRGHLSVYVRRPKSVEMIEPLRGLGMPARVYGLGARERQGNVQFFDIHPERFVEDLATSTALVTTAGNQLVGEALYLGKPVLAVPEPDNKEQEINAHYVATMGVGQAVLGHQLSKQSLASFVEGTDFYRERINRQRMCGNEITLRIIEDHLNGVFARKTPSRSATTLVSASAVA